MDYALPRKDGLHHGLNVDRNPLVETATTGGPPRQSQEWPGHETEMRPTPDHGERTYVGGGKLEGLRALITGGDSGIGRAVAIAFAREGADVSIAYFQEDTDAEETVRQVQQAGRDALKIAADLSQPEQCRRVVEETVRGFGGIDILVNNAGMHIEQHDLESITPEQLERTFRTNFHAFLWLVQASLPHMRPGSAIINTGSVTGLRGHASLVDYAATKAAIHNLTRSLAVKLADKGIRVNAVAPGPVWTPLIPSTRPAEKVEQFGADTFWHRPAQPAEMAPAYVFLASADSRYFTGEILAATGSGTTTR